MNTAHRRTLLLVDDEPAVLSALKRLFHRDGYRVLTAPSGTDALQLLQAEEVGVILSDQRMPGMTGVDFLRRAKQLWPGTIRMTLSGFTDLQSIIDAVNEGAVFKFLTKPWDDDRLRGHVAQAFQHKELADENHRLGDALALANERLEHMLARQKEQALLVQTSAGGLHDLVDQLPAALLGIDPAGSLVFVNHKACTLLPGAAACLGGEPDAELVALLQKVPKVAPGEPPGVPCAVSLGTGRILAWRQALPNRSAGQGEFLMLLPCPLEQAP